MNIANQRPKPAARRTLFLWVAGMLALLAVLSPAIPNSADAPPVSVVKQAEPATILPNSLVQYTAVFSNSSDEAVDLLTVSDTLPDGFSFLSMVSGSDIHANPVGSTGTIVWTGPFSIAEHGSLSLIYKVQSTAPARPQPYENLVEASLSTGETVADSAGVTVAGGFRYAYLPMIIRPEPYVPPTSGYKLAFDSKPGSNYDIFVINPDGTGLKDISNLSDGDLDPTWSNDGTRVAWVHYFSGRGDIMSAKADGSDQVNLTNNPKDDRNPDWSPNGSKIAFDTYRDDRWEIYTMDPNGSNQTRLTNNLCQSHDPLWSPDGTRIAFVCGLNDLSEVYVMNADGSNTTRLTFNYIEDGALAWAPDSIRIAYVEWEGRKNPEIYVVNINTLVNTRLTTNTFYEFSPNWSPDGSLIAFSTNRTGNFEIFTMAPNGSNAANITQAVGADYVPKWSPDGSQISFVSTRNGNKELYVMSANGSNQVRLTNTAEDELEHVWQPVIP